MRDRARKRITDKRDVDVDYVGNATTSSDVSVSTSVGKHVNFFEDLEQGVGR